MKVSSTCWSCHHDIASLARPLGRQSICPKCSAWQHCCRVCTFYHEDAPNQCQEPAAELVKDKESANFCDLFREKRSRGTDDTGTGETSAFQAPSGEQHVDLARQKLKKLFED